MTCLALSDIEVEEAVEQVFVTQVNYRLKKGQRSLLQELKEDRIWEVFRYKLSRGAFQRMHHASMVVP